jgi:hypothetical protein
MLFNATAGLFIAVGGKPMVIWLATPPGPVGWLMNFSFRSFESCFNKIRLLD